MTTEKTAPLTIGNLPISVSAAFTADDVALILGTSLPDAVFIIDEETRCLAAGNLRFLSMVGIDLDVLESQEYSCDRLIHPSDRAVFDAWHRALLQGEEGSFGIRIVRADSGVTSVSMQLKSLRWKRRAYVVGFVKEVSALEVRIAQLKQQVEEQKDRAFEAIKSSLRLYQFNEKIKRTPHLTKSLLNIETEEQLFSEAAQVLVSEEGLNYKDATFLLLEDNLLRVVYSTAAAVPEKVYPITEDNRFSRFLRRSAIDHEDCPGGGILVPLQSRGQFLGIFEVTSHAKEKLFFEESNMVVEWQKDVLQDIGGILALLLDNLRLNREIKRQSIIDPLTQAYNRHYFVGRLSAEIRRAARYARTASLVFIDIDRFKEINDGYGHLQGDEVLRDLGKLFLQNLRDVDVVCRYGGDEFVILLPETSADMSRQTAEKLLNAVRNHSFRNLDGPAMSLPITISVGVSSLCPDETADQFLQRADAALYAAKNRGRNQVVLHGDIPETQAPT